ncbi:MAG: hypothetical protein IPH51_01085 [Rubrivivax sp.]|nr:hypothetical protein [Rubrivivax sp.]
MTINCAETLDEALAGARSHGAPPSDAGDPLAALARFALTDEQVEKMQQTRMICRGVIAHQHLVACWDRPEAARPRSPPTSLRATWRHAFE